MHIDSIDIIIKDGFDIIQGDPGNQKKTGHLKYFIMNANKLQKSDAAFRILSTEELFETYGGRFLSWGATSGFMFLTSLVKDLFKKEEEK